MTLVINHHDVEEHRVDRDGIVTEDHGRQGMTIYLDGLTIAFYDERDAEIIAKSILNRLGIETP